MDQTEINKFTIRVGDLNTPLSVNDKYDFKNQYNIKEQNMTINQFDQTGNCRTLYPGSSEHTFFLRICSWHSHQNS